MVDSEGERKKGPGENIEKLKGKRDSKKKTKKGGKVDEEKKIEVKATGGEKKRKN